MRKCAVKDCKSSKTQQRTGELQVRFYSFPKDTKLRNTWKKLCKNPSVVSYKHAKVCSMHFEETDYKLEHRLLNIEPSKRMLRPEAIPRLFMPEESIAAQDRAKRSSRRFFKKIVDEALKEYDEKCRAEEVEGEEEEETVLDEDSCEIVEQGQPPNAVTIATQTDKNIESSRDIALMELERKLKQCERANQTLKIRNSILSNNLDTLQASLSSIFTKGQIEKLKNPNRNIPWSLDDILSANRLYSVSPEAFHYLRTKNFPLPGTSTLRKWSDKINIRPEVFMEAELDIKEEEL